MANIKHPELPHAFKTADNHKIWCFSSSNLFSSLSRRVVLGSRQIRKKNITNALFRGSWINGTLCMYVIDSGVFLLDKIVIHDLNLLFDQRKDSPRFLLPIPVPVVYSVIPTRSGVSQNSLCTRPMSPRDLWEFPILIGR